MRNIISIAYFNNKKKQFPPSSTNPFKCQRIVNTYFEKSVKDPNLSKQIPCFFAETKNAGVYWKCLCVDPWPTGRFRIQVSDELLPGFSSFAPPRPGQDLGGHPESKGINCPSWYLDKQIRRDFFFGVGVATGIMKNGGGEAMVMVISRHQLGRLIKLATNSGVNIFSFWTSWFG